MSESYQFPHVAWNTYVTLHQHEHLITHGKRLLGQARLLLPGHPVNFNVFDCQRPEYMHMLVIEARGGGVHVGIINTVTYNIMYIGDSKQFHI